MNKILLCTVGAALFSTRIGCAQDAASDEPYAPPPKPPYVARTAAKSAWIIEFTPSHSGTATGTSTPASKPPPKQLKQQDWIKSNGLMKCVTAWSDGTSSESWVIGSSLYAQDAKEPGIHIYSPKSDPRYHDFSTSDFAMLDWITSKDYDRVVRHGADICYLFTAKTLSTSPAENGAHNKTLTELNAPTSPTSVFISIQSGLPVEIDNGDGKFLFHYLPAPTTDLKLPENFLSIWRAYREH